MDCSGTWIITEEKNQLPKMFSEAGYDVWMLNNRGTQTSFEHVNPKEYSVFSFNSKFWDFSFDEMAKYDVKAHINYILDQSEHDKLIYVGHSQGTTQFFVANALGPLHDKVEAFIGLGPVINPSHQYSPLLKFIFSFHIDSILAKLPIKNILVFPDLISVVGRGIVHKFRNTFYGFLQLLCGGVKLTIDPERMAVMVRHEPGGTSFQNLGHWF